MNRLPLAILALLAIPTNGQSATPATFRVLTKIYGGDARQPLSENLTLFDSGVAYDLPQPEGRFLTVYDPAQQRVTLLDRSTQVQSTVLQDDLIRIVAQARAAISDPADQARMGLLAKVHSDPNLGRYKIQFGVFDYDATTQMAVHPQAAVDYGRYVDLAARLNLVRRLGPPPFGRLSLNESMTGDRKLPLELTRAVSRGDGTEFHRKTHQLTESLTESDRGQIKQIQTMMSLYRQVPLGEFPK